MTRLALVLVAGCGNSIATPPPATPAVAGAPAIPHGPFVVVPAELGDAKILERIRHRARLRRYGAAAFTVDGRDPEPHDVHDADDIVPVIGESPARIRVVVDDDHARFAVWIDKRDAWSTALAPAQLAPGVTVEPGVRLVPARAGALTVEDDEVAISGRLPSELVGSVWYAVPATTATPHDRLARLAANAPVRVGARVVATPKLDVDVAVLSRGASVTEIRLDRPYLHVRGYVATSDLRFDVEPEHVDHTGGGHGYGISHADRIELPPSTCLFDAVDGQVLGVQLESQIRLGHLHRSGGWSAVYVDSSWEVFTMYVRDLSDDPNRPRWESCAP